jgi:alpha-glucuronidase
MKSGRTLWDEICIHYQRGVDQVSGWIILWDSTEGLIDQEQFEHVKVLLLRQEREARWWRDACLSYFQTFSKRPLPPGVEPPAESLEYYMNLQLHHVPGYPGEQ